MSDLLAFREYGAGAPLIILHGLFGSARNWHSIAQQLADHHRVFAVDLRNHGQSFWAANMSYSDLAADVADFIRHQQLDSVAVMGHSMGGKTAMMLALQQPELVDKLVVLDIAPVTYGARFEDYIQAMQTLDLNAVSQRQMADQYLSAWIPEAGIRAFLLQNLVIQDGHFDWRINLGALSTQLPQLLDFPSEIVVGQQFAKPTLFVAGERSNYITVNDHDLIRQYFPAVHLETVANAGHWLHADQPAALLTHLRAFL